MQPEVKKELNEITDRLANLIKSNKLTPKEQDFIEQAQQHLLDLL